jgi:ferredoxin
VRDDSGKTVAKMKKSDWPKPMIRRDLCVACENCVAVCPTTGACHGRRNASLTENYAMLSQPRQCVSCGCAGTIAFFDAIVMEGRHERNPRNKQPYLSSI